MINVDTLSFERSLGLILIGKDYVAYYVYNNYKQYNNYKDGNMEGIDQDKLLEMKILDLLEKIGFRIDLTGTFLFKEVVIQAIKYLKENGNYEELLSQLKNAYSQFYFDIARNDLEMGTRSFHLAINSAISQMNFENADQDLLQKVFGSNLGEFDYGELALNIASYLNDDNIMTKANKPIVRKLDNGPIMR